MATVDAEISNPDAGVFSPGALLLAWAGPAAVCALLVGGLFLLSPFAGGILGIVGLAYLGTSLLLTLVVVLLRQAGARRPRSPVVILTATWTSAWVLGILTFGLISLLLGAFDAGSVTPSEGFVFSPVFWLLSFPMYVVFLVTALLFRRLEMLGRSRRQSSRSGRATT